MLTQDLQTGHLVLPVDMQQASEAPQMEHFQVLFLDYIMLSMHHYHTGIICQVIIVPHPPGQSTSWAIIVFT